PGAELHLPHEHAVDVGRADGGADEVLRLLEPAQPRSPLAHDHREPKVGERARHAEARHSVPPVARMKTSSRLAFAWPLPKRARTAASVPSAIFSPRFKIRTCEHTSSSK